MNRVILVHGLWVPAVSMTLLALRLARDGLRCTSFRYAGRSGTLQTHAARLAEQAREAGPAHYVGHSLGGLVLLEALERNRHLPAGRVVLLGSPVRGNFAGRRLARHAAGRWLLGASEPLWREGVRFRWTRPEPLGVVAGVREVGLGRLLGALPGANDGVVTLEETALEGAADRIALPVGHSQLVASARVARQVSAFLRHGRFLRDSG
jgi:pimeloyl-ACP methyl ester carboxylesterase